MNPSGYVVWSLVCLDISFELFSSKSFHSLSLVPKTMLLLMVDLYGVGRTAGVLSMWKTRLIASLSTSAIFLRGHTCRT